MEGRKILIPFEDHYRSVDVQPSLLSLEVTSDDGDETIFVGLTTGRWSRR